MVTFSISQRKKQKKWIRWKLKNRDVISKNPRRKWRVFLKSLSLSFNHQCFFCISTEWKLQPYVRRSKQATPDVVFFVALPPMPCQHCGCRQKICICTYTSCKVRKHLIQMSSWRKQNWDTHFQALQVPVVYIFVYKRENFSILVGKIFKSKLINTIWLITANSNMKIEDPLEAEMTDRYFKLHTCLYIYPKSQF